MCGDVGQSAREELNLIEKGANYGWKIMEGIAPYCSDCLSGSQLVFFHVSLFKCILSEVKLCPLGDLSQCFLHLKAILQVINM